MKLELCVNISQIIPKAFENNVHRFCQLRANYAHHFISFVSHIFVIGSGPSDHYFRSVCLSVCLCRVFLSRLWSDFDQTRAYVVCLGL